ncbi:hypothetical protein ACFRDV_28820 [Streptomyces fagopyri]|uniref:hypothetical protein n=1 Tax=Streptomyces fagopyri TaxID=2662397 RepID=UPI003685B494
MSSTTKGTDRDGGRPVTASGPVTDPFDAFPELVPLRTAAREGDGAAVLAFFAGLGSADEVCFASHHLADVPDVEKCLERAVAARPADPLPRTLLAERYVRVGWAIRSRALARDVSRDRFDQFHEWLRRAERLLIEVCAEHPAYAPAWTTRLLTARGLELGQSEARRRYDRMSAGTAPTHRAQTLLLQQLCPKWGGSWDAAHGFAQECASAASDGSAAGSLVALAHIEHWMELRGVEADTYLRNISVRNDLRAAAERSVLHPAHRPGWDSVAAHSAFAMAFSLGGHHGDAARHFTVLGDRASEFPWEYLADWRGLFTTFRASALETL